MNTVEFKEHSIIVNKRVSEWQPKEYKENISGWGNVSIPRGTKLKPFSILIDAKKRYICPDVRYYNSVHLIAQYKTEKRTLVRAICATPKEHPYKVVIAEFEVD